MDNPEMTFKFIDEFISADENNGFLPYNNITDARSHIKKQLAHIFSDLISKGLILLNLKYRMFFQKLELFGMNY
jgi:hypothetical protein